MEFNYKPLRIDAFWLTKAASTIPRKNLLPLLRAHDSSGVKWPSDVGDFHSDADAIEAGRPMGDPMCDDHKV